MSQAQMHYKDDTGAGVLRGVHVLMLANPFVAMRRNLVAGGPGKQQQANW